jgi:hypothetical protein
MTTSNRRDRQDRTERQDTPEQQCCDYISNKEGESTRAQEEDCTEDDYERGKLVQDIVRSLIKPRLV